MTNETSQHSNTAQPKRRRKFLAGLLAGTALGGLLAAGVAAFSHAPGGWHGHHFGHGGHHGRFADPEAMAERAEFATDWMLKKVNATEVQRQQIKTIVKSAITDLMPMREQHHASHKAALEILKQPTIDRQALETIRRTELERAQQASERIVQALADVADALTPEQRQALAQRFAR